MAIKLSSGLRTSMVLEYGLERMMRFGHIRIYTGPQPLSADEPPSGTYIARVSADGVLPLAGQLEGGLQMQQGLIAGSLEMFGDWRFVGLANGLAGWWRFVWNSVDDHSYSLVYPRIDGLVGESLLLDETVITPSQNMTVNEFFLLLPSQ